VSVGEVDNDCLFCRIVAGEVPAEILSETNEAIAIRDIAPVAPSHVLVIPRQHLKDAAELESHHGELLAEMFLLAQRVAVLEHIAASGYRLVVNVGDDSGNSVEHLHLHVIGARQLAWPPG
jgi:histidine triad (HIT) family protein